MWNLPQALIRVISGTCILIRIRVKSWIRICIKVMRIRNPGLFQQSVYHAFRCRPTPLYCTLACWEIVEAIVSLQLSPSCLPIWRFPVDLFWLIFSRVSACIALGAPDLKEFCQAPGLPALFRSMISFSTSYHPPPSPM